MRKTNNSRIRLDVACVERKLFSSRHKAQAAIMAGLVLVNGEKACKAGRVVKEGDVIEIEKRMPYVSRGGLKLKAALDDFGISLKGRTCADIGVATGGFSDCMLQEGARLVYGVDVGKGQLHEKIKNNPKFIFKPGTNARFIKEDFFENKPGFSAVDVSFISLKLILKPVINAMAANFEMVLLVKPQFELDPKHVPKGIVKSEEARQRALEDLRIFLKENFKGVDAKGVMDCPVKGARGNVEFLWYLGRRKGHG